ncbi:hypothetical protein EDB92DRAFT_1902897 [Lactarius akahatsu]|uniref:Uncharacterized protein n=1 Tax=Lactarius akahatsu TaxID=416441 RepID=A0AAD4L650_9AGAM|nr:hypothetical protein EDB92DRAFT_1902897 [Lactarius akahatsu]
MSGIARNLKALASRLAATYITDSSLRSDICAVLDVLPSVLVAHSLSTLSVTSSQQHDAVGLQPFPPLPPMQPRMPSLSVFISLVLLAAGDLVVAQIIATNCSVSWEWIFNSLNQSACMVAAYMMGTCNGGQFTIGALPPGYVYTVNSVADCECNMVGYNLVSACGACQGRDWIPWSDYSSSCNISGLPPLTFPNAVPSGTLVPQWALLNYTNLKEDTWDVTKASIVGVNPEIEPGSFISTPASGSVSPSSSSSPSQASPSSSTSPSKASPTSSASQFEYSPSSSSGSGSNTGAIAGGIAGGVVALAAISAFLLYIMWKRQRSQAPSAAVDGGTPPMSQEHPPLSGDETYVPGTPKAPMKFYDPSDPSTFPEYQSMPTSTQDVHVPVAPKDAGPNGNSPAKVQAAPTPGYHGLPIV